MARAVAVRGAAVLVGSLVVLGVAVAGVLHLSAVRALDQALLAAAHENAHPALPRAWEAEHSRSPVEVWVVGEGEGRVPAEAVRAALTDERPRALDLGDTRILLLPVERQVSADEAGPPPPHGHPEDDRDEEHLLVAAAAPRVTLASSVGTFAGAYVLLAALVAGLASWVLGRTVQGAFAPVDRARAEAAAVLGFGQGRRLTEEAPEEVRELLAAVNALLDRLDGAWAAQARFTAEAAHELRTPVTAMLGELDVLLRRDRDAAAYRAGLESVREEVLRLRRIVEALTAMARLDTGEAERTREATRAGELAERAVRAERKGIEAQGGTVTLVVADDPPLEGNVALLELALANLLRNAGRHAPGARVELRVGRRGAMSSARVFADAQRGDLGSRPEVRTAKDPGSAGDPPAETEACFEVHDAGPGLAEAEREAVFARFARGSEARRRDPEGLGLGLAFAREVARRHGGDCELDASDLGGLVARLRVPAG